MLVYFSYGPCNVSISNTNFNYPIPWAYKLLPNKNPPKNIFEVFPLNPRTPYWDEFTIKLGYKQLNNNISESGR